MLGTQGIAGSWGGDWLRDQSLKRDSQNCRDFPNYIEHHSLASAFEIRVRRTWNPHRGSDVQLSEMLPFSCQLQSDTYVAVKLIAVERHV